MSENVQLRVCEIFRHNLVFKIALKAEVPHMDTHFITEGRIRSLIRVSVQEIGELVNLRVLSMGNNMICGALPPEIGRLTNLQRIVLHQNRLTGDVPEALWKLGCVVNLAGNVGLRHGPDVPPQERNALEELFRATSGTKWSCKKGADCLMIVL